MPDPVVSELRVIRSAVHAPATNNTLPVVLMHHVLSAVTVPVPLVELIVVHSFSMPPRAFFLGLNRKCCLFGHNQMLNLRACI